MMTSYALSGSAMLLGIETGQFFPRFFMVIHFRGQGLSLRKTLSHCKDYIVAAVK